MCVQGTGCGTLFSTGRLCETQVTVYVVLTGFCPVYWSLKDTILSEHLFVVLWYLTILVAERWYRQRTAYHSPEVHAICLGLLIYLTYGTRSVGIVLCPTVLVYELATSGRLTRFGAHAILTALALMGLQSALLPIAGQGYLEQLQSLDHRTVLANLYLDIVPFSRIWDNGYWVHGRGAAAVILSLVGLVGFSRENIPRPTFLGVSMAIYFLAIVVWPSAQGLRMILPLLPAYLFYVVLGVNSLKVTSETRRAAIACLVAFTLLSYAGWYSRARYDAIDGFKAPSAVELFEFIRKDASENDVYLFYKPRVLALFTGRRATGYPREYDERRFWEYAKLVNVSAVVVRCGSDTPDDMLEAEMIFRNQQSRLVETWRNDVFCVLREPAIVEHSLGPAALQDR